MRRAPLCDFHQSIFDRGFGRNPTTHMTKRERRERAWAIHRACLACQGRQATRACLSRDLEAR